MNRSPISPMSGKKLAALAAAGVPRPYSTLARSREPRSPQAPSIPAPRSRPARKRPTDTGPSATVTEMLYARSGHVCEWPTCSRRATDRHHRLNRKNGGRYGVMRELLNGVAWLLHACRSHHAYVTSPHGQRRERALAMGWLLLEGQDATRVPAWTRHHLDPVWLDESGGWYRYEAGAA